MSWKLFVLLTILLALFAFLPMAGIVVAGTVAQIVECPVDGSNVRPCIIAGTDYGKYLYRLSLLGWLTIYTAPMALMGFAGLVVAQLGLLLTRRYRQ